jgi:hypothetical protein
VLVNEKNMSNSSADVESEIVRFHRSLCDYSEMQLTDDAANKIIAAGALLPLIRLDLEQEKPNSMHEGLPRVGNLRVVLNAVWQGLETPFLLMFLRRLLIDSEFSDVGYEVKAWVAGLTLFKNICFLSSSDLYDVCLPMILAANRPWFTDVLFEANSKLAPDHDAFQPYFLFLALTSYEPSDPSIEQALIEPITRMLKDSFFNIEHYYAQGSDFFKVLPQVQLALVLHNSFNATTNSRANNKLESNIDTDLFGDLLMYRYSQEISTLAMGKPNEVAGDFDAGTLEKLASVFEVTEKLQPEQVRQLYENAPHFVMLALKYHAAKLLFVAQEKNRVGKGIILPGSSDRASDRSALICYVIDNIGRLERDHEAFFLRDAYSVICNKPQATMSDTNKWLHDTIFTRGASAVMAHLAPALNALSDNQLHVLFKRSAYTLNNLRENDFPQLAPDDEVFACQDEQAALHGAAQELGSEAFRGAVRGYAVLREDAKTIFDDIGSLSGLDKQTLQPKKIIIFSAVSERQQLQNILNGLPNREVLNRDCDFAKFFLQMMALSYLSAALLRQPIQEEGMKKAEFFHLLAENYEAIVENFTWDDEQLEESSAPGASPENTLIQKYSQQYLAIKQFELHQQQTTKGMMSLRDWWSTYLSKGESDGVDLTLDGALLDHLPPPLLLRLFGGDETAKQVRDSIVSIVAKRESVIANVLPPKVDRYRSRVIEMFDLASKCKDSFNENTFRFCKVLNDELKVRPDKPRLNKDKDFAKFFLRYRSLYYMDKANKGGAGAQNSVNKANFFEFLVNSYDEVVAAKSSSKSHFNQMGNSALIHRAYRQYQETAGNICMLPLNAWAIELLEVPGAMFGASVDSKACTDLQCLVGSLELFDLFGRDELAIHFIARVAESSTVSPQDMVEIDRASVVAMTQGRVSMYSQAGPGDGAAAFSYQI